jgi:acylphosphatase
VQGVWFRDSTRRQAEQLGLCGHAINCVDGSVEVLACGDTDSLNRLEQWLYHGPPMAKVKSVTHAPVEGACPRRFTTG